MERLHNFCRLPSSNQHLLIQSALLLSIVRIGLWLLPFQTLRCLLAHISRTPQAPVQEGGHAGIQQIVWAVALTSRYMPAATCLTQALATQVLLKRRGHPACLRIGVARSDAGAFQAHAWVECQGKIVIGGIQARARYTPLPPLDGGSP